MKRLLLWSLLAALGLAGLAGIGQAVPDWAENTGLDLWNLPRVNRQLEQQARRSEDLDSRLDLTLQRIEIKQQVVDGLLAGQMTLHEAAAKFRELTRAVPLYMSIIRSHYPSLGEEEMFCRYVLEYSRRSTGSQKKLADIISRLERDLDKEVRRDNVAH